MNSFLLNNLKAANDTGVLKSISAGLLLLGLMFNLSSAIAQTCNCTEYIYLNEPNVPAVLKFEVGAGVSLTEKTGANGAPHWYPGSGVSEMSNPHGLGKDLNGRLYIGAEGFNSQIRQLNCDGVIAPVSGTTIFDPGTHQNIFSIGNTLYVNRDGGPTAFNTCTGATIGQMCLAGASGNLWGLSYNETTQMVYASQRNGSQKVWVFTRAQLEAGIAGGPCINPIITQGPNSVVNPGESFLPNSPGAVFGVTSDNTGNIYVVKSSFDGGISNYILKYNAAGQFVAQTPASLPGGAYGAMIGIIWSETTNRLYVSNITDNPATDCISAFDPVTMTYLGTAAPNPNLPLQDNAAKAIAIIKECCPVGMPAAFTKNVCGAVGAKFYLNEEAFNSCDGVVCGSSWAPINPLTGMTFNSCDNSVTITSADACGNFTLNIGAVSSTGCGAQSSTFTICNVSQINCFPISIIKN